MPKQLDFPQGLDAAAFLREFWQRRPLLIRDAFPGFRSPLSGDELAGLACEPGVESRIVLEDGVRPWEVRHGPFAEADFAALPETHWTLLVQDVDKHVPAVAALLECFDFLPRWRLDDIMISFAADQGSVGPHTDEYDVFLIQAQGRRRWRIDPHPDPEARCVPGLDLRILERFEAREQWVLEPGDCLYLPPGVPHWGIAEGPCMTWSVGLRAPDWRELGGAWFDQVAATRLPRARYRDPDPQLPRWRGEIPADCARPHSPPARGGPAGRRTIRAFAAWFGAQVSEPKEHLEVTPVDVPLAPADLRGLIAERGGLEPGLSRILWTLVGEDHLLLFAGGETHRLPAQCLAFAELLSVARPLTHQELAPWLDQPACLDLLCTLYNQGHYAFPE